MDIPCLEATRCFSFKLSVCKLSCLLEDPHPTCAVADASRPPDFPQRLTVPKRPDLDAFAALFRHMML